MSNTSGLCILRMNTKKEFLGWLSDPFKWLSDGIKFGHGFEVTCKPEIFRWNIFGDFPKPKKRPNLGAPKVEVPQLPRTPLHNGPRSFGFFSMASLTFFHGFLGPPLRGSMEKSRLKKNTSHFWKFYDMIC